jgi:putative ABC transport system permease protein
LNNLLKMSLRNLWRRRRRSLLTWMMICVGTALIVWTVGLSEGTYGNMIELATRGFAGHFQVLETDYNEKPSLHRTIHDAPSVMRTLAARSDVVALTGRVECAGLLSAGSRSTGAFLVGVDPVAELSVSSIAASVRQGNWLGVEGDADELPLLLGAGLARRLRAELGQEISFVSQAADGSIAAELFILTGILETGSPEFDSGLALIRLADAQTLLALEGRLHRIVGTSKNLHRLGRLEAEVDSGDGNRLLPWQLILEDLDRTIRSDRAGGRIFLLIILIVVLLGVTNTMSMAIFERTKEFGVMLALGCSPMRLVSLTLIEAFWLSLSGVLAGVALGSLLTATVTIPVGSEPIEFGGVVIETMSGRNNLMGNLYYPAIVLVSGLLAGLLPGLRAAKLSPAVALRQQ